MQDGTKNKVTSQLMCGELGYNDLNPQEKHRITDAVRRGVTRREFVTWLMAAGVTMASAGGIFTSAKEAMAATPKRGGKIKYATSLHGPSDTMDPIMATSSIDYTRHRAHYNSLVQLNEKIIPQPELAEEFSSNEDATEHTFKIRGETIYIGGQGVEKDRQPHRQGDHEFTGCRLCHGFGNIPDENREKGYHRLAESARHRPIYTQRVQAGYARFT